MMALALLSFAACDDERNPPKPIESATEAIERPYICSDEPCPMPDEESSSDESDSSDSSDSSDGTSSGESTT